MLRPWWPEATFEARRCKTTPQLETTIRAVAAEGWLSQPAINHLLPSICHLLNDTTNTSYRSINYSCPPIGSGTVPNTFLSGDLLVKSFLYLSEYDLPGKQIRFILHVTVKGTLSVAVITLMSSTTQTWKHLHGLGMLNCEPHHFIFQTKLSSTGSCMLLLVCFLFQPGTLWVPRLFQATEEWSCRSRAPPGRVP